jgi:hypothetical protein
MADQIKAARWSGRRRAPTNQKSLARVFAEEGDTDSAEDGILIPLATAKDTAFRGYDFILDLVDRLPKNAAVQCNPGNPQIAFAVLECECTSIRRELCRIIRHLGSGMSGV